MVYDITGKSIGNEYISNIVLTFAKLHSGALSNIQSSFVTPNGKVWMLKNGDKCVVSKDGETLVELPLNHSIGHANSSNYESGYAYISDWEDGTLIHVFSVDDVNNTLTYSKDITIPTTYGRTEYFVFDNENQIFSIGWEETHSGDSDYMVLGLWKKDTSGVYQKVYEYPVNGVTIAQGMCVHNDRMYIVNNSANYKHIGIVIIDLKTGVQITENSQSGEITTIETEGITPISTNTFLITGNDGSQFTMTESFASSV